MSLTGFPGQSADARRRLARRLRPGALRRDRRAGRALRPRPHRTRPGGRRVEPGRHVLAARQLARRSSRRRAGCRAQVGNRHLGTAPYDCYRAQRRLGGDRSREQQALPHARQRHRPARAGRRPALPRRHRPRRAQRRDQRDRRGVGRASTRSTEVVRGARARRRRRAVLAGLHRRPAARRIRSCWRAR